MCSLLQGGNWPNPHSKWGNTPQKTENNPSQPPAAPFLTRGPRIRGKSGGPAWLGGCWQESIASLNCLIGRGGEPKNQQLLNFCCARRLPVRRAEPRKRREKAAGLREGLSATRRVGRPDGKC